MKRIFIYAVATLAMCACAASCKGNKAKNAENEVVEPDTEIEEVQETAPEEMTMTEAFEAAHMICPFYIQDCGKVDENGEMVTREYKFICDSSQIGGGTMADWVYSCMAPMCGFNVDGWHFVGKDIVNGDETFKIADDWAGDEPYSLSSFCTVPTVKYEKPAKVEPYTYMRWGEVRPMAEGEELPLRLVGNRHSYDSEELQRYAASEDFEMYHIQANFFLNEYIELYSYESTKDMGLKAVCLPYNDSYESIILDEALLEQALFVHEMDSCDEKGMFFSDYINIEKPAGVYDLVFFKDERPFARISLFLSKESEQ